MVQLVGVLSPYTKRVRFDLPQGTYPGCRSGPWSAYAGGNQLMFPFFSSQINKNVSLGEDLKKNWNGEENESYISMNETWSKTSLIGEGL